MSRAEQLVQGDGKIKLHDVRSVLPALCFSAEQFGLGNEAGLSAHAVLVKMALWCCYTNLAPSQLCSTVGSAGLGILHQRQVVALLKIVAKGSVVIHLRNLVVDVRHWIRFDDWCRFPGSLLLG